MSMPSTTPPPVRRHSPRAIRWGLALCAISLLGRGGSIWWALDLVNHFRPFTVLGLAGLCMWLLRQRSWRSSVVVLAVCLFDAASLVPYYWPRPITARSPDLSILVCNVLSRNSTPQRVIDLLRDRPADVLVLLEVTPEWSQRLAALKDIYPFRHAVPRADNFGIALLSKSPLVVEVHDFATSGVPSLIADLNDSYRLIATHPLPPISSAYSAKRDRQLRAVAEFCAASDRACLVAGDLNASPWSHAFHTLIKSGRLFDSALGHGIAPTWPTFGPFALIPIDHVLIPPGVDVLLRRVERAVGSDHRPLRVELGWK